MEETKRTARLAGLLYLVSSIPGAFALLYVPGKVFVKGDAAATAERIRASETLLRVGIAAELLGMTLFIFVALVLYRLFKPVREKAALAMMVLILLSIPVSFLNVSTEFAALDFAGGGTASTVLSPLDPRQRDALAYLSLHLHGLGLIVVAQVFWGLWLFPFGICVIRSGFIPRFLGVLLMVAGCGYIAASLAELLLPQDAHAISRVTSVLTAAELPIIVWLLVWGAKPQRRAPA
ncbi:MAG TPA: DUF4386 domain-containing protein [Thermoanaerobaculia bacterium]|nr:DUF4386 domain-containing protein [Thermoanaerobaculia bacterium]